MSFSMRISKKEGGGNLEKVKILMSLIFNIFKLQKREVF